MKVSRAHEMRGFLISITVLVVLLIVLVVLVNTIFSVRRINQDQEREKETVKVALVHYIVNTGSRSLLSSIQLLRNSTGAR